MWWSQITLEAMQLSRVRGVALLVAGLATPVAVLLVNVSAFVMRYLVELRLVIAASALVSSLVLNGISAVWVLRQMQAGTPQLYREYRAALTVLASIVIVAASAMAAYFTFEGMRDPRHLPDPTAVVTAVGAVALPMAVALLGRRLTRRGRGSRSRPPRDVRVRADSG